MQDYNQSHMQFSLSKEYRAKLDVVCQSYGLTKSKMIQYIVKSFLDKAVELKYKGEWNWSHSLLFTVGTPLYAIFL